MKHVDPALVERVKESVLHAGKQAARSVGRSLQRAIRVAAEYAAHLHRDDGVPKPKAVTISARAVLNTVNRKR